MVNVRRFIEHLLKTSDDHVKVFVNQFDSNSILAHANYAVAARWLVLADLVYLECANIPEGGE
jgi:hypothetical protein